MIDFLFTIPTCSMFLPNIKVKAWPGPCSLKLVSWSKLIESSNRFSSKVRLCGLLFGWIKFIPKIIENRAFKIFITIKSVYQTHTKYISLFLFPLCKNNLIWQPTLDFQLLCEVFAVCWHPDGEWCGKSASCPNTAAARRPAPARRPGTCHWWRGRLISSKLSTGLHHIYVDNTTSFLNLVEILPFLYTLLCIVCVHHAALRTLQLVPRLLSASLHSPVRETWTQCWGSVALLLPSDMWRICKVYLCPDSVIFHNFYHFVLGFPIFSSSLGWVESRSVRVRPRPRKVCRAGRVLCCVGYWNVLMQWIITTLYYLAGLRTVCVLLLFFMQAGHRTVAAVQTQFW